MSGMGNTVPFIPEPRDTEPTPVDANWPGLTRRQTTVASGLAVGQTCRDIATTLGISVKTVDTHRGAILERLNVRNNVELALWALRHKLVEL